MYIYAFLCILCFFVKECKSKQYGFECNQTCGNCSNGEECHHVDGRCLNGCDVGVFGDKCDQGKMLRSESDKKNHLSNDQTYVKKIRNCLKEHEFPVACDALLFCY